MKSYTFTIVGAVGSLHTFMINPFSQYRSKAAYTDVNHLSHAIYLTFDFKSVTNIVKEVLKLHIVLCNMLIPAKSR